METALWQVAGGEEWGENEKDRSRKSEKKMAAVSEKEMAAVFHAVMIV